MAGRTTRHCSSVHHIEQVEEPFCVGEHGVIDFYAVMNAMATDYGEVAKAHGVDNVDFYADMVKAFLHDRDAVQGKIKRYYEGITKI